MAINLIAQAQEVIEAKGTIESVVSFYDLTQDKITYVSSPRVRSQFKQIAAKAYQEKPDVIYLINEVWMVRHEIEKGSSDVTREDVLDMARTIGVSNMPNKEEALMVAVCRRDSHDYIITQIFTRDPDGKIVLGELSDTEAFSGRGDIRDFRMENNLIGTDWKN